MSEALEATTFTVTGMTCSGCARKIDTALRGLEGVSDISLHYPETTLGVLHSRNRTRGGVTAPAQGLYLLQVDYPQAFALPQPRPLSLFG